jgi:hypothetical protein
VSLPKLKKNIPMLNSSTPHLKKCFKGNSTCSAIWFEGKSFITQRCSVAGRIKRSAFGLETVVALLEIRGYKYKLFFHHKNL